MKIEPAGRALEEQPYLDLLELAGDEAARLAAGHPDPVSHIAFTVSTDRTLLDDQAIEVRLEAARALRARPGTAAEAVVEVTFLVDPHRSAPRITDARVVSPDEGPDVLDARMVDASGHGTEPMPVRVVPRLELRHGGQVRSATIGDAETLTIGTNSSFAFRPTHLPVSGADLGVRVRYDHEQQRLRISVEPGRAVHRVVVADSARPNGERRLVVLPEKFVEVGLHGSLELHPTNGSDPFVIDYALETAFAWRPSEVTVRRMVVRTCRALGLTAGGFRRAPWAPRQVSLRVPGDQDGSDELREIPAMLVYAAASSVPRAGIEGNTFLKIYLFLNIEDRDLAWRQLEAAEEATSRIAGHAVPVRHFRLGEQHGNTSVLLSAGSEHPDVPLLQDHALSCIVAVSPEVVPWGRETRCRLDQLAGVAAALGTLHAAGLVYGDVKPDNTAKCQDATGGVAARLLDVDALVRADSPLLVNRRTPSYSLPVLLSDEGMTATTRNPVVMRAQDYLGFTAIVVAALSGRDVADVVAGGGAYLDPGVPQAVRTEVEDAVRRLRAIGLHASEPLPVLAPVAWLKHVQKLMEEPPPPPGHDHERPSSALQKILDRVDAYQPTTAREDLEKELESYARTWLVGTQLVVASVLFLFVYLMKGVLL